MFSFQSLVSKRTHQTTRGLGYSYFLSRPQDASLPYLLFLHGFPATSRIWRYQIEYFHGHGFGLVVPDMLGFGDTDRPIDPELYRPSLICQDVIDILDVEHVETCVVVGHDLGSRIASRLANLYDSRFLGYAFLAVPYNAPRPLSSMEHTLYATKRMCGYELCGHTLFFAEEDAEKVIESHIDSFQRAMFPCDPKIWVTEVAPTGALKAWLSRNQKSKLADYLTDEDVKHWKDSFGDGGITGALSWYRAQVSGINADDDKNVPPESYQIQKPVFFGAARHDYISRSVLGIATTTHDCKNPTIREFSAGHWLMLSAHRDVNNALFSWIMDII